MVKDGDSIKVLGYCNNIFEIFTAIFTIAYIERFLKMYGMTRSQLVWGKRFLAK
ncbi:hypothetical protein BSBH6_01534 [Bacillus subtilis]|nr:hypothetical protein BSBH6_01534 [Bacillus subtilis]RPK25743.1 hypothetical protein BH5_02575 [Bacillus subtilis]